MDETKDLSVSPEEHIAEQEATKEVQEEDLRTQLAEEFGFDPETDAERLDKLVQKELKHRKTVSTAVKQKIKIRTELEKLTSKKTDMSSGQPQSSNNLPDIEALVDQKLSARLEQIEIQQLNLPEELTEEVKKVAKLQGISIKEAANSDYIKYKREQYEQDQRIQKATPKWKGASGLPKGFDPSKPPDPSQFRLDTEEGQKQWEAAKAGRKKS